jgi:excisionase family DNA binding protein
VKRARYAGPHTPAGDRVKSGQPVYLTPAQAAELLQVSEKTISRWSLEDASMPVLRRGRVVRFERERLLAWLQRQEPRFARRVTQGPHKSA